MTFFPKALLAHKKIEQRAERKAAFSHANHLTRIFCSNIFCTFWILLNCTKNLRIVYIWYEYDQIKFCVPVRVWKWAENFEFPACIFNVFLSKMKKGGDLLVFNVLLCWDLQEILWCWFLESVLMLRMS